MADIFLSYSRNDRETASALAEVLSKRGWSVWWDPHIPAGKQFDDVIEEQISDAQCIVVLWSASSVESQWVRNEASEGVTRSVLIPLLIDAVKIPFAFRQIQAADLTDWNGLDNTAELQRLLADIARLSPLLAKKEKTEHERQQQGVEEEAAARRAAEAREAEKKALQAAHGAAETQWKLARAEQQRTEAETRAAQQTRESIQAIQTAASTTTNKKRSSVKTIVIALIVAGALGAWIAYQWNMTRLVDRWLVMAQAAIAAERFTEAKEFLGEAARLKPNDTAVRRLQENLARRIREAAETPPAPETQGETETSDSEELASSDPGQTQIERLIAKGTQALQDNRLVTPNNANAMFHFRAVLELVQDQSEATNGIAETQARWKDDVTQNIHDQHFDEAERLLGAARPFFR